MRVLHEFGFTQIHKIIYFIDLKHGNVRGYLWQSTLQEVEIQRYFWIDGYTILKLHQISKIDNTENTVVKFHNFSKSQFSSTLLRLFKKRFYKTDFWSIQSGEKRDMQDTEIHSSIVSYWNHQFRGVHDILINATSYSYNKEAIQLELSCWVHLRFTIIMTINRGRNKSVQLHNWFFFSCEKYPGIEYDKYCTTRSSFKWKNKRMWSSLWVERFVLDVPQIHGMFVKRILKNLLYM